MVQLFASWRHSLRGEIHRRQLHRRLLEVVARLPYEPESRCMYQKLLDEELGLARSAEAAADRWHGVARANRTD